MRRLTDITTFKYTYDSKEEREDHIKLMMARGFEPKGQVDGNNVLASPKELQCSEEFVRVGRRGLKQEEELIQAEVRGEKLNVAVLTRVLATDEIRINPLGHSGDWLIFLEAFQSFENDDFCLMLRLSNTDGEKEFIVICSWNFKKETPVFETLKDLHPYKHFSNCITRRINMIERGIIE